MNSGDVVTIEYNMNTEKYYLINAQRPGTQPVEADAANAIISQGKEDGIISFEMEAGYQRFIFTEGNGYFEQFFPEDFKKTADWLESKAYYLGQQKPSERFPKGMRVPRSAYQFNRG